jgi:putative two-component system response regulator
MKDMDAKPLLLLVDDEPTNLQVLRHTLQDDYRLIFAKEGMRAVQLAKSEKPDLILLDVMMPDVSGYEVCEHLKRDPALARIPVIFVTALANSVDEAHGLELGAVDYIIKPFNPSIVKARVRTHLSLVQAESLRETRLLIVQRLGCAAEFKDNETGRHVIRMSQYSKTLALANGCGADFAEDLLHAAPMHDIGKIGIPDAILQKPGKLTPEEIEVMRRHPQIGADIIGEHESGLLKMARVVALNHHEKWDGGGYPRGLKGDGIPLAAQIVALADVFDALTNARAYKKAWPLEDALNYLREESGKHFNPELVRAFMNGLPDILRIRDLWGEPEDQAQAETRAKAA